VLALHNEAHHLAELRACLERQNYPSERLQIIAVDDRSMDATPELLREYCSWKYVRVAHVSPSHSPKKFALATGIAHSQSELIVLTDADCRPGPDWIKTLVTQFQAECIAVAGFSPVFSRSKVLSQVLCIDSVAVAAMSMAGIGWKKPIMATGRNLAYRRSAFEAAGGFGQTAQVLSGDDDLLLQRLAVAQLGTIAFACDTAAHVPSQGPETFFAWLVQKRRHISASKHFNFRIQLGYSVFHLCNLLLWLAPLFIAASGFLFFLLKCCVDLIVMRYASRRLQFKLRWQYFPLWEFSHVLIHTLIGPTSFFGKIKWRAA